MVRTLLMTFVSFILALAAASAVIYLKGPRVPHSCVVQSGTGASAQTATLNDRFDAAIACAKNEYRERYEDLKDTHDHFMVCVTILVTIVGLALPLISLGREEKIRKEIDTAMGKIETVEAANRNLRKAEARGCLATAKFTWVLLLHDMEHELVQGYRIAEPLYRICNAMMQASREKDELIMRDCVNSFTKAIAAYNAAVKLHEGQHDAFKAFVVDKRFLVDSAACDLSWFFGAKDKDYEKILRFFNDFGIKMFGEFS